MNSKRCGAFRTVVMVALVAGTLAGEAPAQAVGPNAMVQSAGCYSSTLAANDDLSTDLVALPFAANFVGTTFSALYVNNNGNVTFDAALGEFTPFPLVGTGSKIIAPFFADVDTGGAGSGLVHYGNTTFGGRTAFCASWSDAGAGAGVGYFAQKIDKLNKFQLLLVDRSDVTPGDFDIVFNYDQVQWETGDASGGTDGLGGSSARAGFSNGSSFNQELLGSDVDGAFLDPGGLVAGSLNSSQLGRYVFPVRNGTAPPPGQIQGRVTDTASTPNPVAGARVQVCRADGSSCPWVGTTNSDGSYGATGLPHGSFDIKAFPPSGANLIPTRIGATLPCTTGTGCPDANGERVTGADIRMPGPVPPPPGTGISPSNSGEGGVPVIYWDNPTVLSTDRCPGGTASYSIDVQDGGSPVAGPMSEVPTGSGHYQANILPFSPRRGTAAVHITVTCPDSSVVNLDFPIYIDPSGTVETPSGAPIAGATVTLYRSDTGVAGTFIPVPDGSALMSPSNRTNPDITNSLGEYGWDVVAGYYTVRASRAGCTAPTTGADFVESEVLSIPPEVTGLVLRLDCSGLSPGGFTGLTPSRLLDTREAGQGPCVSGSSGRNLRVTGVGGVPATAASVALNITVVQPSTSGFVTVSPAGQTRPLAANLNYVEGQVVPNMVLAKVGTAGQINIFASSGCPNIVVDVAGFFASGTPAPGGFTGVTPSRLLDTREAGQGPCVSGTSGRNLTVSGVGGVPVDAASVALNITVVQPSTSGFVTVSPAGQTRPLAANLNYVAGQVVPNMVLAKVGAAGEINIFASSGCPNIVVDVAGWFAPGTPAPGGFTGLTPSRLLDTREAGQGPCVSGSSGRNLTVTNVGGVPVNAASVALNITVVQPSTSGFVTVSPAGQTRPLAANLNYVAGQVVPNMVLAKVGAGGQINIFASSGCPNIVVDVAGWFVAPPL